VPLGARMNTWLDVTSSIALFLTAVLFLLFGLDGIASMIRRNRRRRGLRERKL
jgi:hypothetical protein